MFHEKNLLTPNRNPNYNLHYLVDILVLTIGIHPQIWAWGYDPIFMND